MATKYYLTANSRTPIKFDTSWRVLDIGSGHHPHPRADILADKYLLDNTERTGREARLLPGIPFVVADVCRLPFKDKSFDFVICSHVAEHIEDIDSFCAELNRVAHRGYVESPSQFTESLLHVAVHRWFVSKRHGQLVFSPAPEGHPLGWFGKLFFSVHFYGTRHIRGREVFGFACSCRKPWHYFFVLLKWAVMLLMSCAWPFMYTRLHWEGSFSHVVSGGEKKEKAGHEFH